MSRSELLLQGVNACACIDQLLVEDNNGCFVFLLLLIAREKDFHHVSASDDYWLCNNVNRIEEESGGFKAIGGKNGHRGSGYWDCGPDGAVGLLVIFRVRIRGVRGGRKALQCIMCKVQWLEGVGGLGGAVALLS